MAPGEPTVGYWVVGVAVASAEVMTHPVFMSEAPLTTSGPKIPDAPLAVEANPPCPKQPLDTKRHCYVKLGSRCESASVETLVFGDARRVDVGLRLSRAYREE
jgi:hypothetical protein